MNIIHHHGSEEDPAAIAALVRACLTAIRQSRAGQPVYIGALLRGLLAAPRPEVK